MLIEHSGHADFIARTIRSQAGEIQQISDYITRSWSRCIEHGLDPMEPVDASVITHAELCERQEAQRELLQLAKPELTSLYSQLPCEGYSVLLSDPEGVIVSYIGDPNFHNTMAKQGILPGAIWTEQHQGTNGPGTCLLERHPLVIRHNEHFLARNTQLTCAASPIMDDQGELLAVLDVSTLVPQPEQNILHLVNMSAQVIESQVFLRQFRNYYILRFHPRSELLGMFSEGRIAYTEDGQLIALNRAALFLLGINSPHDAIGRNITDIFNTSLDTLARRSSVQDARRLPIFDAVHGRQFFASLQPPATKVSSASRAVSDNHPDRQAGQAPGFEQLHFGDPAMAQNIRLAERILHLDLPILLHGETGTGKEVFARAIHRASEQGGKRPFVAINCTALPEALIESELFGYRSGAFTGASKDGHRGKILLANGGTLFLDEIGDMPLHLQARLLRVLEEREVTPLGSETPIKVDIKLISASHCDLQKLISQGRFREDLYYRLRGILVELPPLRQRLDIESLLWRLFEQENRKPQMPVVAPEVIDSLKAYQWPGNIRQARSVIRLMLALQENNCVTCRELPPEIRNWCHSESPLLRQPAENDGINPLKAAERSALLTQLERNYWNVSRLAKQLNLSRNTLYRKMKLLNIKCPTKG